MSIELAARSGWGQVLGRLQRGLEKLYRIETEVAVADFLIDAPTRQELGGARSCREQLLLLSGEGTLDVALFVDEHSLANLQRHDPSQRLDDSNLADFLIAVEGVSHFVYAVWRALLGHQLSALELELQAEVDKYLACLLVSETSCHRSDRIRRRLFTQFELVDGLDHDERDRYQVANSNALRYSRSLEQRYLSRGRVSDMLHELRRFYRMSLGAKLDFIRAAAA